MAAARRTPAQVAGAIPEVALGKHIVTTSMRPYPTREGAMMSHKRELMTYVEYTSGFTCATVESRNRPVVGLGAFGGAMTSCLENLNRAKSCRLAGSG